MVPSSLEPCALALLHEGPYMSRRLSSGFFAINISALSFTPRGSREHKSALKAWQLLRLAALSGQVPKPAGARRSRREDLKAKARPGDNAIMAVCHTQQLCFDLPVRACLQLVEFYARTDPNQTENMTRR